MPLPQAAQECAKPEGMTFIDPFDDYNVQGSRNKAAMKFMSRLKQRVLF